MNKILQGNCLDKMKELEDSSIDTIITDPPYGLSFMGKKWDYDVPSIEIWKECLRVLKPGGTALIFAGSRTQHRMAVNVEDAGFILKDTIMWLYGCLSEDTEILTKDGFKLLHKTTKDDKIMIYDNTKNTYKWETPERWSVYRVHEDTCYRIKSDTTDQIVSRGHRCLVEREGKLVFKEAWELSEMEQMPVLSEDFYTLEKEKGLLLFLQLLRKSKGLVKTLFSKRKGKEMSSKRNEDGKESSLERWSNLLEEERKLQADKICEVSKGVFTDGEKRWICNGTPFDNGSILGDMLRESSSNTSYQSQSTRQPIGKPDVVSIKQGTQTIRGARITKIEYSGIIFCPTVSTGAFIARRNGKVFITGNSGFPKATDISKQLDKSSVSITGASSTVKTNHVDGVNGTKTQPSSWENNRYGGGNSKCDKCGKYMISGNPCKCPKPEKVFKTPEAKLWNGWKSHGLKPAYEPILVAVKPNEGTYANNALKWGVAGLNIDGGRIGYQSEDDFNKVINPTKTTKKGYKHTAGAMTGGINRIDAGNPQGRFPSNVVLDEEAGKMLDEQSGELVKGGASRFFYCAKASKAERNAGCEELEEKDKAGKDFRPNHAEKAEQGEDGNAFGRWGKIKNNHPTVKPLKLMEYLCTLTKTPTGGIVLDPFAGSGTTGVACQNTGRDFILIEMTPEYIPIIEARTGVKCDRVEQSKTVSETVKSEKPVEQVVEDTNKNNRCECGGNIVNIKSGRCCEDCLTNY